VRVIVVEGVFVGDKVSGISVEVAVFVPVEEKVWVTFSSCGGIALQAHKIETMRTVKMFFGQTIMFFFIRLF